MVNDRTHAKLLDREELIEQAYFFRTLCDRLDQSMPVQELLPMVREEVLATTQLPLAIDFLQTELVHSGSLGKAMTQLLHYFTPFQAYVMNEAEREQGRFDMRLGFEILQIEAEYRSNEAVTVPGLFMYHFETLCRNRLQYDPGLAAVSEDPMYDEDWRSWILTVRRQIGIIELSDLIYVRSAFYREKSQGSRSEESNSAAGGSSVERPDAGSAVGSGGEATAAVLFDARDGKIALANRRKDPLYLFSALQRQLGYPVVPRRKEVSESVDFVPQLMRRVERLEAQLKLMEDEQKGGIDLAQFYKKPTDS